MRRPVFRWRRDVIRLRARGRARRHCYIDHANVCCRCPWQADRRYCYLVCSLAARFGLAPRTGADPQRAMQESGCLFQPCGPGSRRLQGWGSAAAAPADRECVARLLGEASRASPHKWPSSAAASWIPLGWGCSDFAVAFALASAMIRPLPLLLFLPNALSFLARYLWRWCSRSGSRPPPGQAHAEIVWPNSLQMTQRRSWAPVLECVGKPACLK